MSDDPQSIVAAAVQQAPAAKRNEKKPPAEKPAPAKTPPRRDRADDDTPYDTSFPEDCPVEPLGINGDDVFFLDAKRQLRVVKAEKLNQGTIRSLFCQMGDLKYSYWPRWSKPDEDGRVKLVGWRPEQAADVLLNEASRRGIWDILDRVRGPGCWRDDKGQLVMHCGDLLFHGEETLTPRPIGRHVYPSAPPKPHPAVTRNAKPDEGCKEAKELLTILKSWNWVRPDTDPYLALGWIGAAIMGGALSWRPLIWITGDLATGKSTLHSVIKSVMGPGGMIAATDATAAGLWQTVGHASLPIALDELEARADNRKAQNIITLARHAASGGQTLRGGSDHKNAAFTVRSCFLFSSILIPPMLGQDISRMAVLQLKDLQGVAAPAVTEERLEQIGTAIRGRILREWPRLRGLIDTWKHQLATVGHGGRGGDQFGTLLACLDLLTSDAPPESEALEDWSRKLNKKTLAEFEGVESDTMRCLSFMLSSQLDLYRGGERRSIISWILQAAGKDKDNAGDLKIKEANRALGNIGLMVSKPKNVAGRQDRVLYVSNSHQGLSTIFKDTDWRAETGTNGVWVQALRRIEGCKADEQRFNGLKMRCSSIPLEKIINEDQGGKND